jgi:predicted porin
MKKLLIATAALAMVAGTAQAQSSVTVYGSLDMGYSSQTLKALNTTNAGTTTETKAFGSSEGLAASRIGFNGTEDLGGGIRAAFVYELGINVGDSTGGASGHAVRASHITLSDAKLGSINIGRNNAIGKNMNDNFTAFAGGGDFEQGSVTLELTRGEELSDTTAKLFKTAVADRLSNQITLTSANISGFTLSAQMSNKSSDSSATNGKAMDSGNDNLAFRADYAVQGLTFAYATTTSKSQNEATSPTKTKAKLNQYGATYTMGSLKFFGLYNDASYAASEGAVEQEHKGYDVGATYTMGKTTFLGSIGKGDIKNANANISDLSGYQAQVRYSLSKRTTAYALYGETKSEGYNQGKSEATMVGLRHSF